MRYARRFLWGLAALALAMAILFPAHVSQAQVSVANYFSQAAPGSTDNALTLGGTVTRYGVALNGVTSGTGTLDGANPTPITPSAFTTGIRYCVVTQVGAAAPADDPNYLTVVTTTGATTFDVYAWKNTSGTDPTYIASTDSTVTFNYFCTGT